MTIPTRPAPAPPQMRNFNINNSGGGTAAADANASLEQLRLQLQQQQKLTIKLPPPPKGGLNPNVALTTSLATKFNNNNNNSSNDLDSFNSNSSITRKFPKARYSPATNWDDTPFEASIPKTSSMTNGNVKKAPPPRPPPPKVLVNGRSKIGNTQSSTTVTASVSAPTKILSNIFHRKKHNSNINNNGKQQSAARIYGVSSGIHHHAVNPTTTQSRYETTMTAFTNSDWNAAWSNTTSNDYDSTTTTIGGRGMANSQQQQDAQLISFDSPPSSPTFTQKSNSDCVSVDSFSSDSNFSSPQNGSVSQPESGFEDDFSATSRSRPATTSPLDPWETFGAFNRGSGSHINATANNKINTYQTESYYCSTASIGTAPVRNFTRSQASTQQDNPLCNGRSLMPPAPSVSMPTIIKPKISQKPKAPRPPMMFGLNKQNAGVLGTELSTPPSPPMPQCLPPPAPTTSITASVSMLDVISGKADAIHLSNGAAMNYDAAEPPYGIALYDFEGAEEGDLSFRENDKIYLLERVSEDWYRGRTRAGCEGIFPTNYIDIKVPLTTEAQSVTSTKNNSGYVLGSSVNLLKVRCLYNFPAELEGDLELRENDMVTILYRINEDWLFGEINNKQGQFPANFLEYIPTNIPLP